MRESNNNLRAVKWGVKANLLTCGLGLAVSALTALVHGGIAGSLKTENPSLALLALVLIVTAGVSVEVACAVQFAATMHNIAAAARGLSTAPVVSLSAIYNFVRTLEAKEKKLSFLLKVSIGTAAAISACRWLLET